MLNMIVRLKGSHIEFCNDDVLTFPERLRTSVFVKPFIEMSLKPLNIHIKAFNIIEK